MGTINLKIGETDISEYVSPEGYSVRLVQKKSENSAFVKYDGSEVSTVLGYCYEIAADLEFLPDNLARSLAAALSAEKFPVDFTDPFGSGCANFRRDGDVRFEVTAELDEGLYWDVSLALKSELITSGSGGGL